MHAHAHRARRLVRRRERRASPRRDTAGAATTHRVRRDAADQHLSDRVRGRAVGSASSSTERRPHHHRVRAPLARGGGRPRLPARAQRTARSTGWSATSAGRFRSRSSTSCSRPRSRSAAWSTPARSSTARTASSSASGPRCRSGSADGDDLPRGRAPVVRRPRHHALVRRPVAEGRLRHLHGREGAGRARARRRRVEDVLSPQQAGGVRGGRDRGHDARSGRSSPTSTRPRATTARSSTTRRRRCSSS